MPHENYERELLARVSASTRGPELEDLSVGELQRVAMTEGIDVATALIYDRIHRSPRHGPFIRALETFIPAADPEPTTATLVVVPGGFYREFPGSGADGRVLREAAARLGCRTEIVPVESFGSLARNARILNDWLSRRLEEPMILASLSKAGAEVKLALAAPDAASAFRNVRWWLNLSGVLDGTPLADWLLARRLRTLACRLVCWLRGYDFGAVREMAGGRDSPLDRELCLPAQLRVIHVVGFPLAHQVTRGPIRRGFKRLRHLGPNDGAGIMLARVESWPGFVYPVWGADHYLRPQGKEGHDLAARLMQFVIRNVRSVGDGAMCDVTNECVSADPPGCCKTAVQQYSSTACSSKGI